MINNINVTCMTNLNAQKFLQLESHDRIDVGCSPKKLHRIL